MKAEKMKHESVKEIEQKYAGQMAYTPGGGEGTGMPDSRFWVTAAAIVLVSMTAVVLAGLPGLYGEVAPIEEHVTDVEIPDDDVAAVDYEFIIREYEGKIAVFSADNPNGEPELVMDVPVRHLPDLDRQQMEDGIPVRDWQELSVLLEDYGS